MLQANIQDPNNQPKRSLIERKKRHLDRLKSLQKRGKKALFRYVKNNVNVDMIQLIKE